MISKCRLSSMVVLIALGPVGGAAPAMAQVPSGAGSGNSGAPVTRGTDRPDWGGSGLVLYAVGYSEFTPTESSTGYSDGIGRYSTVADGSFLATPHLPSGVLLTYLELDYCDNSGTDNTTLDFYDCSFLFANCSLLGTSTLSSGNGFSGCSFVSMDLTPENYTVINNTRRLVLNAKTQSGTSATTLLGAYIGYKLQVSPAPGFATFPNDTPTTHPYFRFIEALARSGITAGCGAQMYCPNSPITRGEMAVFLSVALGLHFPN